MLQLARLQMQLINRNNGRAQPLSGRHALWLVFLVMLLVSLVKSCEGQQA